MYTSATETRLRWEVAGKAGKVSNSVSNSPNRHITPPFERSLPSDLVVVPCRHLSDRIHLLRLPIV
jgi:hypothetical protein